MRDAVDARLWPGSSYGIGLIVRPTPSGELLGHTGIFPGYLSGAWHMPGVGATFAVQLNADSPGANRALEMLTTELAACLAGPAD